MFQAKFPKSTVVAKARVAYVVILRKHARYHFLYRIYSAKEWLPTYTRGVLLVNFLFQLFGKN